MWFPLELCRIIKNYQLGQKYWMNKFAKVLEKLPKKETFIYTSYVYKIRFFKLEFRYYEYLLHYSYSY